MASKIGRALLIASCQAGCMIGGLFLGSQIFVFTAISVGRIIYDSNLLPSHTNMSMLVGIFFTVVSLICAIYFARKAIVKNNPLIKKGLPPKDGILNYLFYFLFGFFVGFLYQSFSIILIDLIFRNLL